MALRKIIEYPEPLLRLKARKVETFDDELNVLIKDMAETMFDAPGVGLAAPQVAESIRLIVVDTTQSEEEQQYVALINPEIVEHEGNQMDEEGCLSVPELTAQVKRFKKIRVRYQSADGTELELTTDNRFAVILQHEIDHLNGVLFIDHLTPLKRNLYKKKRKKMLTMEHTG